MCSSGRSWPFSACGEGPQTRKVSSLREEIAHRLIESIKRPLQTQRPEAVSRFTVGGSYNRYDSNFRWVLFLRVNPIKRNRLSYFFPWHPSVIGQRFQGRQRDEVAIHFEKPAQRFSGIRLAETVGA